MFERIAIMGAGSMGTVLGAYIAQHRQVDFIDAYVDHVNALNEHGATVEGTIDINVPVKAYTPDTIEGVYDLIIYFVKQTTNEQAVAALLPHVHENTIICTLQNGFPELYLAEVFGEDRIMGCTVGWGASFIRPGVSRLTSETDHMEMTLGWYRQREDDRIFAVKEIFEHMCPIHLVTNLPGARWTKLMVNCTFSGVSASLGANFGQILDSEEAMRVLAYVAKECIDVGDAAGYHMEPTLGHDLHGELYFDVEANRVAKTMPIYLDIWDHHRALRASMLMDLENGRKCEIDAINGVVCDMGRKVGVATPMNDKIREIVHGIMDGKYQYTFENLSMFRPLFADQV